MNISISTYVPQNPKTTFHGTDFYENSTNEGNASGFICSSASPIGNLLNCLHVSLSNPAIGGLLHTGKAQRERFAEYYDFSTTNTTIRDEETGFGYFGARYYDSELLTGWLSVDPMADKYPSMSPYNYCSWNPVKLVDPNGDTVVVTGSVVDTYLARIQSEHLRISRDVNTGVLSVSLKDKYQESDLSDSERNMYDAINSSYARVEITASTSEYRSGINIFKWSDGKEYSTNYGGSNMGTEYYEAIGVAVARAFVDPSLLEKNGFEQGEAHETIEGYLCALVSVREKRNIPIAFAEKGLPGENSDISKACRASVPARVDNCGIYEIGPNAVKIK